MKPFKISKVDVVDSGTLTFVSDAGATLSIILEGDCCSGSYFEESAAKEAAGLLGSTLSQVRRVSSKLENFDDADQYTQYHALELVTENGVTTLDWRNESNGYYDGWANVAINGDLQSIYEDIISL